MTRKERIARLKQKLKADYNFESNYIDKFGVNIYDTFSDTIKLLLFENEAKERKIIDLKSRLKKRMGKTG